MPLVFSIKCIQCESRLDPGCLDPFSFDPVGFVDCEKIAYGLPIGTMCRKIASNGLQNLKKKN